MIKHHSHQPNFFKKIFKTHGVAVGLTLTSLVVVGGILGLFVINSKFSPTSPMLNANNTTVRVQATDHDTNPQPRLLINSLTDTTQTAKYDDSGVIMEITRENSGRIPALFRIEGRLIYRR